MMVFALGVLTFSLRETAVSILRTGQADFTVGQKGVSDVIFSSMDEQDANQLSATRGERRIDVNRDPINACAQSISACGVRHDVRR